MAYLIVVFKSACPSIGLFFTLIFGVSSIISSVKTSDIEITLNAAIEKNIKKLNKTENVESKESTLNSENLSQKK